MTNFYRSGKKERRMTAGFRGKALCHPTTRRRKKKERRKEGRRDGPGCGLPVPGKKRVQGKLRDGFVLLGGVGGTGVWGGPSPSSRQRSFTSPEIKKKEKGKKGK